ncbi:MAG: hypothetical protein WC807_14490 [Hyphomicrobium sp.]|jgi:hypothetical protein
MLLGVTPLGVYALTEIPGNSSATTITGDKGDLTLTGRDAALRQVTVLTAVKGDLALAGRSATFAVVTATVKGSLTLTGRNAVFVTLIQDDGTLTLQGRDATFSVTSATAKGDLTLTGISATFRVQANTEKGDLTLTGQHATLTPTEGTTSGALTLTGQDAFLRHVDVLYVTKGDLTLTGQAASFLTNEPVSKGDLTLTGCDAALTPTMVAQSATLTLTPHEAILLKIGGGGSDELTRKPKRDRVQLRHIEREIEIVGPDGLPKKVPLLERFAPPPPPPPLVVLPVGKPLPRELTAPLDLPLPALPDIGEIERHAIEARDLQDAMAAIAQIPDPVSEQITRLLEDYRDMQDIARVLAEID